MRYYQKYDPLIISEDKDGDGVLNKDEKNKYGTIQIQRLIMMAFVIS